MNEYLLLHTDIFNLQNCLQIGFRLALDLLFTSLVVFGVYLKKHRKHNYIFTYVMFNVITFTLCFLLRQIPIELGFALGLFAVFGILRYRTEPIQISDLTYLFIVIGIGILNAVANEQFTLSEVLLVNLSIVGLVVVLEYNPWVQPVLSLPLMYDNLDLVREGDQKALLQDIQQRTGLNVQRISISRIDLLRDIAEVQVYYIKSENQ
jgi:hypothetical protein